MNEYNPEIKNTSDISCELSMCASRMDAVERLTYLLDDEIPDLQDKQESIHRIALDTVYSLAEALRCIAGTVRVNALTLAEKLLTIKELPEKKEVAS